MRILIAADSFKDALSAPLVCRAIAAGLHTRYPDADIREFPLADGGEGTFEILALHLGLQVVEAATEDPLLRPIVAKYGFGTAQSGTPGAMAMIEMAQASGLQLLHARERNPLHTSTRGTGLLIADALRRGAGHIVLAIGGSATNDGGIGMAHALGWRFLDAHGAALSPTGGQLPQVSRIVAPPKSAAAARIDVICDVTNPLCGPHGAAHIYGRQKGADDAAIALLDAGLRNLAGCVARDLDKPGLDTVAGAGAAGGTGFGAMAFLNAHLRRGIDLVMDLAGFDSALTDTDVVITGEGMLDGQTLHGKLISGICRRAQAMQKPVIALCGSVSATPDQIHAIGLRDAFDINPVKRPLPEMLAATADNLQHAAAALDLQERA